MLKLQPKGIRIDWPHTFHAQATTKGDSYWLTTHLPCSSHNHRGFILTDHTPSMLKPQPKGIHIGWPHTLHAQTTIKGDSYWLTTHPPCSSHNLRGFQLTDHTPSMLKPQSKGINIDYPHSSSMFKPQSKGIQIEWSYSSMFKPQSKGIPVDCPHSSPILQPQSKGISYRLTTQPSPAIH